MEWGDERPAHIATLSLRWRWRRWRAAHYVWLALNTWLANPTPATHDAYRRARDYQDHVWAARP